jgi:hypothetical protein
MQRSLGCPIPGGILPHGMYKADHAIASPGPAPFDFHPVNILLDIYLFYSLVFVINFILFYPYIQHQSNMDIYMEI